MRTRRSRAQLAYGSSYGFYRDLSGEYSAIEHKRPSEMSSDVPNGREVDVKEVRIRKEMCLGERYPGQFHATQTSVSKNTQG